MRLITVNIEKCMILRKTNYSGEEVISLDLIKNYIKTLISKLNQVFFVNVTMTKPGDANVINGKGEFKATDVKVNLFFYSFILFKHQNYYFNQILTDTLLNGKTCNCVLSPAPLHRNAYETSRNIVPYGLLSVNYAFQNFMFDQEISSLSEADHDFLKNMVHTPERPPSYSEVFSPSPLLESQDLFLTPFSPPQNFSF